MIVIPTIPHSGSTFVIDLFGSHVRGWESQGDVLFDHIFPYAKRLFLPVIEAHTTIIPLRHPKCVEKSWRDRGRRNLAELVEMFEIVAFEIDPLEPFYLPLDVDNRQGYLDEVNVSLGLALETDWAPRGGKNGNHDLRHADIEGSDTIRALCARIEPFLQKFYGSPPIRA